MWFVTDVSKVRQSIFLLDRPASAPSRKSEYGSWLMYLEFVTDFIRDSPKRPLCHQVQCLDVGLEFTVCDS